MLFTHFKTILFSLILLYSAGASSADTADPNVALTDPQIKKLLDEGGRVAKQGRPDTAITEFFDLVIADYERQYKDDKRTLYVAHSAAESLLYLVSAAAADDKGKAQAAGVVVIYGYLTDALVMKAYALSELHRPDDAKAVLQRAIALAPQYPLAWNELGFLFENAKDWPSALDAFEHAADSAELMEKGPQKDEHLARAWRGKAFVYTEQGKLHESEALYKKCLKLNPDDGNAKRELEYIKSLRTKPANTPPPAAPLK